ncbi:MAG: DUF4423 domain-containing protein [Bdellovibrio sp.]|nr:DUF4423 domain-containing protein [Bdellovibrio sp.]
MKPDSHVSYRDLIKEEFAARIKKNKSYSLRAFARDLNISIGYLSMIFNGKRHLSLNGAMQITQRLQWSLPDQAYFVSLLEAENPKTEINKNFANERIQKIKRDHQKYSQVDLDVFTSISVWYYGAIYTLLTMREFKGTVSAISKKLNLQKTDVEVALQCLKRLGFVRVEKAVWHAISDNLKVKSAPSSAIRFYHRQMLDRASKALEEQKFEEREFSNITLTVDPSQIDLAKKKISEFQSEMAQLLEGKKDTELYQLSVQLFKLVNSKENEL